MIRGIQYPVVSFSFVCALIVSISTSQQAVGGVFSDFIVRSGRAIARRTEVKDGRRYVKANPSVENLDLKKLTDRLKQFGIVLPITLEGEVSARVTIEVPIGSPRDAKLYRLQGTIESNRLIIDGFEIHKLLGNLSYRDGIAKLDQLTFQIPHEQGPPGRVSGNAALDVLPVGDLCGMLSLDSLPLSSVKELLSDLPDINGRATGQFEFCVANAEIRKIDAWSASGEIKAQPLEVKPLTLDRLTAKLNLAKRRLQAHEIVAVGYAGTLEGTSNLELKAPFPVTGKANFRSAGLQKNLDVLAPEIARLVGVGNASGEIQFEAALDPLKYEAEITAQIDKLVFAERSIERIQAELFFDQQVFRLKEFQAIAFGGTLQGSAVFNHRTQEMKTQAKFQELEFSRLMPTEVADRWQLAGEANGSASLTLPAGTLDKPNKWSGSANLNVETIAFAGTTDGQLVATLSLAEGALQFESSKGRVAGLNTSTSGHIRVSEPFEFSASLEARKPDDSEQPAVLPFGIRGRVELNADAKGQWQPRRFQIDGRLTADDMTWNDFLIKHFETEGRVTHKALSIRKMKADLYSGSVSGSLEIPISAPQPPNQAAVPGKAEIAWDGVDLAEALNAQGIDAVSPDAEFSGMLTATVPSGTWRTPRKWTASLEVEFADLSLQGNTKAAGTAKAGYRDSSIRVIEARLTAGAQSLSGTGRIATVAPYRWQTSVTGENLEIETVLPFVAVPELDELSGTVSAAGNFEGSLESIKFTGQGQVTAEALRFGTVEAEKVHFDLSADEQTIAVKNAEAKLLEGRVNGSAQWPWASQGTIALDADWSDLSVGPLFEQFRDELPELLSETRGLVGGSVSVRLPRNKLTEPFTWTGRLEVKGTELKLGVQEIGWIAANAKIEDQSIGYSLDGELLSGSVEAEGDWSPRQEVNTGTLQVENVALGDLLSLIKLEILDPFQGEMNLQVEYRHGGPFLLEQASGSVSVTKPSWKDTLISESLTGLLAWNESRLTVENLSGTFSRGELRADLGVSVGTEPKGTYSVLLQKADLQKAVSTWTDFEGEVAAGIDFRLQGTLGEDLRGAGTLAARRLRYRLPFNRRLVDLGNWRVPIRIRYAGERLQIDSLRSSGTPFNSRSIVDVSLTVDRGVQLEGEAKFNRAQLPQILHSLGRSGSAGRGFLSGTLSFSGRNLNSFDDLEMTVDSRLQQTQATTVPLLSSLQPFLSAALPLTETFQAGQLRGRLKNSVFRIERFSLNGQHVNLYALGTVTLTGRINLDVTADTGKLTEDRLLSRAIVSQLLTVASPPVALLVRANQFLADRVVHLTATGTLRNPRIQVRPVESLGEEAIRFFLLQAVE